MDNVDILLVEDSNDDAELIIHAFKKNELNILFKRVHDGEECINYLYCNKEYKNRDIIKKPKLILLDINLPKLNGIEVLKIIKNDSRTKHIPVIIMTIQDDDKTIDLAYENNVNAFVSKNAILDNFNGVMRSLGMLWILFNKRTYDK